MGQGRFGGWWYLGAFGSLPPAPAPSPWGTTLPPPPSYFTLKLGWAEGEGCSRGGEGGPPGGACNPSAPLWGSRAGGAGVGLHCQQLLGGREGDCPPVGPYPPWMELIRQKEKAEVGGELGSLPPGRQSPPWGRTPARLALWGKSGPSLPPVPPYRGPPPTPARDTHPPPSPGSLACPSILPPPPRETPPPVSLHPQGTPLPRTPPSPRVSPYLPPPPVPSRAAVTTATRSRPSPRLSRDPGPPRPSPRGGRRDS